MNRKLVCIKFKEQLKALYNTTNDIVLCFRAYLGFLIEFALDDRYKQYTPWQIADMEMAIYNAQIDTTREVLETAWNYTRRGSKSRNLTVVGVFWCLLDKAVIWRCPHSDQLNQAATWFEMNPFVKKQVVHQNKIEIFNSPTINISVLSAGRVASREADCLIYDEMGWCFNHLQLYEYYKASRPMIAASTFRHILHASTPARSTVFHEEWQNLEQLEKKYNTKFTSYHNWRDCPWITKEWVEMERLKNADCPWYVDQNYEALWVVYGGAIFTNVIRMGDLRHPEFPADYTTPADWDLFGGVDFNGENTQHYLVLCRYDDKFAYVLEEIKFLNLWLLEEYANGLPNIFGLPTIKPVSLELEDALFNTQFTEQTKRMGLNCIYQKWDEDIKQNRVNALQRRTIVIDAEKCPLTYKNLLEAGYDENSRLPKIKKRLDHHGLDALLHCLHDTSGSINVDKSRRDLKQSDWYKKNNIMKY